MTIDCSASSQVCTLGAIVSCAMTAVDTIGSNTNALTSNGQFYGTAVTVTTARKLTQIEAYYASAGTSLFTWVVYSSTSSGGSYTKIFEVTTSSMGTMFHSSGTLNVGLEKGKYYLIGVVASGVNSYSSYSNVPPQIPFSFGLATNSISNSSGAPATITAPGTSYYIWNQRFTTTKP